MNDQYDMEMDDSQGLQSGRIGNMADINQD
jgi:hypothetical protein